MNLQEKPALMQHAMLLLQVAVAGIIKSFPLSAFFKEHQWLFQNK